jgi:predicted DNA-binding transcriptional regulator YafY
MGRPTTRLLTMLELLQTRGRLTGAELAQALEINRRTVRRSIVALEDLGIPIVAERGRDGGYRLVAGFKLPPMMFTPDEALAVAVGLVAVKRLGLGEGPWAVASAQAKLERVAPPALSRRIRAVAEAVTLTPSTPGRPTDPTLLATLSLAAVSQTGVQLRYQGQVRGFDCYGVVHRWGCWYAVGWCHLRAAVRLFRVDRVQHAAVLERRFSRPAGFDAAAEVTRAVANVPRTFTVEARLHTTWARASASVNSVFGTLERHDGEILLHAQVDALEWAALELARLPFRFTIRRPTALRTTLKRLARRLMTQARRAE